MSTANVGLESLFAALNDANRDFWNSPCAKSKSKALHGGMATSLWSSWASCTLGCTTVWSNSVRRCADPRWATGARDHCSLHTTTTTAAASADISLFSRCTLPHIRPRCLPRMKKTRTRHQPRVFIQQTQRVPRAARLASTDEGHRHHYAVQASRKR